MCALKKFVITGPESSGKTTLAQDLARHFGTLWVPEYAREYLTRLDRPYTQNDLLIIARGQLALEDKLAQQADSYLFCDTSLEVIAIWSMVKYGVIDPLIDHWIAERHYTGYLLCQPDLPWEPDPLREAPDEAARIQLYSRYRQWLETHNLPWEAIYGQGDDRLQKAVHTISNWPVNNS